MYVSMYVCMYVRVYVCTYVRMYACMQVCMYVCMYVCPSPILVARPSKTWVCARSFAGNVGPNPTATWMFRKYCVLSGRGLCDGLIFRPEES